ncbi:alpha/beta hydrolase family protein [Goodfellowiella coeruleoviolacea]|uniref:Alpha/beta hydrolase family protein n=1 Tax=Goodfellowiella coeruleoviolacea TaxID=334858 RepID=A0AAE3GKC6_9PSEU|nr:lipase [Goodfellowiella coeruleoviolacea]MCP2169065.1 Alpha/beta hydrolase family protein [Goodfellowiella coeruleoviolacea]
MDISPSRPTRRSLLAGLVAAGLVLPLAATPTAAATPAGSGRAANTGGTGPVGFALPEPTGWHGVGTTELHLVDHDRQDPWVADRVRELVVSVWYPTRARTGPRAPWLPPGAAAVVDQANAGQLGLSPGRIDYGSATHGLVGVPAETRAGGWPVVLYSPGAEQTRADGTSMVEELVSRGYVVVTVDHPHEARAVEFPGGRVELGALPPSSPDVLRTMIATRVADTRFVLDQLTVLAGGGNPDAQRRALPAGLGRALNLSSVGMFGHSAGGFTAAETMLVDDRIDAGVDLDGSMMYSRSAGLYGEVATRGLDRPFLLMGAGSHSHLNPDQADPSWPEFWRNQRGWKLDLNIAEGEHFSYTDYQAILPRLAERLDIPEERITPVIGTVNRDRIVASQRAYLTAFFDQHLRGLPQRLLTGPSPAHPDVTFVS